MKLGEKLKQLRTQNKLTYKELANRVNSSPSYLCEIEKLPHRKPSAELVNKLADVLNVTSELLLKTITKLRLWGLREEGLWFFSYFCF